MTDTILVQVPSLNGLQSLLLGSSQVSDAGLVHGRVRDLALKAVREFTFTSAGGEKEGTTNVSLSITSPSLEGFRRIEVTEKWLRSDATRKSFVSELVRFDDE